MINTNKTIAKRCTFPQSSILNPQSFSDPTGPLGDHLLTQFNREPVPRCSLSEWLRWLEQLKSTRSIHEIMGDVRGLITRASLLSYQPKIIVVSGTNGKGSCAALLEAVYGQAKWCVGAFTSPHLLRFNERIRIQGTPVGDEELCAAFNEIESIREAIPLNYFQYSFLAALLLFKKANLDLIILEVGVGGRSDIVNAVDADLSIITSIDLDHCDILGETRELIALDKAGVMRKGKSVVCGDEDPPLVLSQEASRLGAPLFCLAKDFSFRQKPESWTWMADDICLDHLPIPRVELSNAAVAIMAIRCLIEVLSVRDEDIVQGLKKVYLPGRQEMVIYQGKKILLDVAHNPAATQCLAQKIESLKVQGKIYAITGWQKDKDIKNSLRWLKQSITDWFLIPLPKPRGAGVDRLASELNALEIVHYHEMEDMVAALVQVLDNMTLDDWLVIFGSFVTVFQAYAILRMSEG